MSTPIPIISVRNLSKKFGGIIAVKDVSFDLERSKILGLIGPNGSGKTTILNLVMGFETADGGDIYLNGRRIRGLKPHQMNHFGVACTFQLARMFKSLTVKQNLIYASKDRGNKSVEMAKNLLQYLEMPQILDQTAGTLSYGQRKLVELARAVMTSPSIILLDEPTAGVNPRLIEKVVNFIRDLTGKGVTFLIVEHNIGVVMKLCDKLIALDHGELISSGTASQVLHDRKVVDAYLGNA